MRVTVHYNASYVDALCREDGQWLVTTHGHKIVKVQKVEVDDGPAEAADRGEHLNDDLTPFRTTVHRTSQVECITRMLSQNTQWLVLVRGGMITQASNVGRPVGVEQGQEPVTVEEGILVSGEGRTKRTKSRVGQVI